MIFPTRKYLDFDPEKFFEVCHFPGRGITTVTGVSVWANRGTLGTDYNRTQATGSKQPAYGTVTKAGHPAVVFDGVDDQMIRSGTGLNMIRNLAGRSFVYVLRLPAATVNKTIMENLTTIGGGRSYVVLTNQNRIDTGGRAADGDALKFCNSSGNDVYVTDSWGVFIHTVDHTGSGIAETYWNGTLIRSVTGWNTSAATSNTASSGDSLGSTVSGGSYAGMAVLMEAVSQHTLTAVERTQIVDWVNGKFLS